MRAIDLLLQMSVLELATGTFLLILASAIAAVTVFMIGFRLAGLPAGAVWMMLGIVKPAEPRTGIHDHAMLPDDEDAASLTSLHHRVAAASAGHSVAQPNASAKS